MRIRNPLSLITLLRFVFCLFSRIRRKAKNFFGNGGSKNPSGRNFELQAQNFCFNAYTKSFNKVFERKGSLFQSPVFRLPIYEEAHFANTLRYIHLNPVHHKFVKDLNEWEYSSYRAYLSDKITKLSKGFTLDVFGNLKGFKEAHNFENLDISPFD